MDQLGIVVVDSQFSDGIAYINGPVGIRPKLK